jgi:hypothetical protein
MSDQPSTPAGQVTGRANPIASLWRWFDRPEGRTLRLLLFGLVVALPGTFELSRVHPAPWTILGTRADGLEQTLAALDRGWPVLTSLLDSGDLYRAGSSDDQGIYLFVPLLAHVIGYDDPVNLLRWIALVSFAVPIALYPWMIRELTGSTLAALGSPFALLIGLWLMPLGDIYWVGAWVTLALVPPLLLLDRRWPRYGLVLLVGLLVLASAASAIRSQSGAPILIGAVLVTLRRPWTAWAKAGAVVVCLVAFLSVSTFGMAAARAVREHELGGRALTGDPGRGHPFWHTAYIGLGYLPNDWDIRYQDSVAYRDVLRIDPKARYLGPAYDRILRDRYFRLVREDPLVAGESYGSKVLVALRSALPALVVLVVLGPWLLFVDRRRARWRRDAVFLGVAALIGIAGPLIAAPYAVYLSAWIAVVVLAVILAVGAVLGDWRAALAYARSPGKAVVGSAAAAVAVLAVVLAAPGIERRASAWNAKPPPKVLQPPDATH